MHRYEISNTTVKPTRLNERGDDTRTLRERVGHPVSLTLPSGKTVNIGPGRRQTIDEMTQGILYFQEIGHISIVEAPSVVDELRSYTQVPKEAFVEAPPQDDHSRRLTEKDLKANASEIGEPVKVENEPNENPTLLARKTPNMRQKA
jgi:hypothetical protein